MFQFFSDATGQALPSLESKGSMLRRIPFPPVAVPLSSVLTSSFVYGLSLVIVFGFILASGISPTPAWLELIPLVLLLLTFTAGAGMVLSLIYVPIRDVQQIWLVAIRLLFFLTPVAYPIELAPEGLQRVLMLNPLAVVIVEARHALIDSSAPTAAEAAGGGWLAGRSLLRSAPPSSRAASGSTRPAADGSPSGSRPMCGIAGILSNGEPGRPRDGRADVPDDGAPRPRLAGALRRLTGSALGVQRLAIIDLERRRPADL